MRVLVACEFSGRVRDAFKAKGHYAVSCDLLPSETPGEHYLGDVKDIINDNWDLMIAHPPCTYLCSSGLHWNKRVPERKKETLKALEFVKFLLEAPVERIALENPIGRISTAIRPPDQKIQPYMFGHPESKTTCLWLKNLPKLKPTKLLTSPPAWIQCEMCEDYFCSIHNEHVADCKCPPIEKWKVNPYETGGKWDNQTPSGQNNLGPSEDRWKIRSRTYEGIAAAMAEQWNF